MKRIKKELFQSIIDDPDLQLDLAKALNKRQNSIYVAAKRKAETPFLHISVIEVLKKKGFTDEEIFAHEQPEAEEATK